MAFNLRQFASNIGNTISNVWNGKNKQNQQINQGVKGAISSTAKSAVNTMKPIVTGAIKSMANTTKKAIQYRAPIVAQNFKSTASLAGQGLRGLVNNYVNKNNTILDPKVQKQIITDKQKTTNSVLTTIKPGLQVNLNLPEGKRLALVNGYTGPEVQQKNNGITTQTTPIVSPTVTPTSVPIQTNITKSAEAVSEILGKNPSIKTLANSFAGVGKYIKNAADKYGVDPHLMSDIAYQESKFNPSLRAADHGFDGKTINPKTGQPYPYSSAAGLFQFTDGTWNEVMRRMGIQGDKMNPQLNALAAAFLIAKGELSRWDASKNVWGPFYTEAELINYDKRIAKKKTANKK